MKSPIAMTAAALPFALLLVAARPVHAELWTDDDLSRETAVCALGRTSRLQATSRSCITCHDGTTGTSASYTAPQDVGRSALSAMHSSHPIEIDYAAAQARNPSLLHPPAALPAALVLPEGKVSCVTCHDGASREPHHAAMSLTRSRLCTSCHDY